MVSLVTVALKSPSGNYLRPGHPPGLHENILPSPCDFPFVLAFVNVHSELHLPGNCGCHGEAPAGTKPCSHQGLVRLQPSPCLGSFQALSRVTTPTPGPSPPHARVSPLCPGPHLFPSSVCSGSGEIRTTSSLMSFPLLLLSSSVGLWELRR